MKSLKLPKNFLYRKQIGFLLSSVEKAEVPTLYKVREPRIEKGLPLLFAIFSGPGTGKDAVLANIEDIPCVPTATNRVRRKSKNKGEPKDNYVWMRKRKRSEKQQDYLRSLVKEYKLLEYAEHSGSVYGVPQASIDLALRSGVATIRTGIHAVKILDRKLKGEVNFIKVFILPDSYEQVWIRLQGREDERARLEETRNCIENSFELTHFYIHNTEYPEKYTNDHHISGLDLSQKALRFLIDKYRKRLSI
ncbi:MAG: hypothetical protein PHS44_07700 [Candidatus Dojkabacteria bacterium]|nr:hypothetical protein [Candidatus Dojkabacteria bacterium]